MTAYDLATVLMVIALALFIFIIMPHTKDPQ